MEPAILIIEDEVSVRSALRARLADLGHTVQEAATAGEGLAHLAAGVTELVLLDYKLPDADGLEVLERIRREWPDVAVVVMTGFANVGVAVQAMRLGAADYVTKPFSLDEMMVVVEKVLEEKRLRSEVARLRAGQHQQFGFDQVIARSPKMREILDLVRHIAQSEARTILLQGESGTGKDLVAKVIHYNSPRGARPFMNITCTALPESLLESELFGHERGAFTDARRQKQGLFELADGGTIFLDEIGDMPQALQARLLRFLEEKAFRRVGGTVDIRVDVRIIAATNQKLKRLVETGVFREDLFYRLNVLPINLPPLRERPEDVPLLAAHFIEEYNREFHKEVAGLEPATLQVLQAYRWPGNVREMRNIIERAMLLTAGGRLTPDVLPTEVKQAAASPPGQEAEEEPLVRLGDQGIDLREVERQLVAQAIEKAGGNQSRAAGMLGITRDQLRYRLEKFGLRNRNA